MSHEAPRLSEFKVCDESWHFQGPHQWKILGRIWKHNGAASKGTIVGIHGYSEHSDRYAHFARFLTDASWDVAWLDLPGHGRSDGMRSNIDRFSDYLRCVEGLVTEIEKRKLPKPYHLFAHSLGGLIATRFAQTSIYADRFQSLTLSSPLFGLANYPKWAWPLIHLLSAVAPNMTLPNDGELGVGVLSTDKAIMENRLQDPMIKSQVTFNWLREFFRAREAAFRESAQMILPLGMFLSGNDHVVSRSESERFFQLVRSKKKLRVYEGLLHEILNEPSRLTVMQEMLQWIEAQGRAE